MSEERKPVWWKCPQCGLIVQCMDTVPKDGDDWPAGRACSRCLCGEMVLLWPGTPVQPDASRQLLTDAERDAVEWFSHFGRPQNTRDQQPRTKEAAHMNGENERSVASGGSVADEPVAWGVMRVGGRFEYASVCRELAVAMQSMFEQTENWKYEVAPLYANSTRAVRLPKLLEKMHGETEYGKGYNTAVRTCQEILATAGVEPVKS